MTLLSARPCFWPPQFVGFSDRRERRERRRARPPRPRASLCAAVATTTRWKRSMISGSRVTSSVGPRLFLAAVSGRTRWLPVASRSSWAPVAPRVAAMPPAKRRGNVAKTSGAMKYVQEHASDSEARSRWPPPARRATFAARPATTCATRPRTTPRRSPRCACAHRRCTACWRRSTPTCGAGCCSVRLASRRPGARCIEDGRSAEQPASRRCRRAGRRRRRWCVRSSNWRRSTASSTRRGRRAGRRRSSAAARSRRSAVLRAADVLTAHAI